MDHVRPDLQSYRYVDRARCSREADGIGSSVVQTGVKSLGGENKTAQPLPIQS